jgi:uncharacterized protein
VLTSDLLRVRRQSGKLLPRYLGPKGRLRMLPLAEALIAIVRSAGRVRREALEGELETIDGDVSDRLVIQGLRKLVLDRCDFSLADGREPAELHERLFLRATAARKALGAPDRFDRAAVIAEVAAEMAIDPAAIEARLFADLKGSEELIAFRPLSAQALVDRYDVALAQGIVLRATRVAVALDGEEPGRVRRLFRAARFHGLLHRVTDLGEGRYLIELDGPFSLFTAVQKYGFNLALFLPEVLRCERWHLRAEVLWGKRREPHVFELSPNDRLVAPGRPIDGVAPEIEKFVEGFRAIDSAWQVEKNDEIIALPGETVCVPDLIFTSRETGEQVFLEAFGVWSRKAVWQRVETIRRGFPSRIILAVSKNLRVSEELLEDQAGELYVYKASMRPRKVLERLDAR